MPYIMPLSVWRCIEKNADGRTPLWINDAIRPFMFSVEINRLENGTEPLERYGVSPMGTFSFDGDLTRLTTREREFVFETDLNALRGLQSLVKMSPDTRHYGSILQEGSKLELQIQGFIFVLHELPDLQTDLH
jgi:hypothetical protein